MMTENQTKVKAQVATVKVGHLEFEGLLLPDGSFAVAVPQIADLFGINKNYASQELKRLMGESFCPYRVKIEFNNSFTNAVDLQTFEQIMKVLSCKGNKKAQSMLGLPNIVSKKSKPKPKVGYIYLLDSGTVLKLGYSTNVKSRVKQLQRWEGELEILTTKKGTLNDEQAYHRYLKATGDYFGDEWYPFYRKLEILNVLETKNLTKSPR